jgi:hypothetical protein
MPRRRARPLPVGSPVASGTINGTSFCPAKNLGPSAFRDTTSDAELAHKVQVLRNYGSQRNATITKWCNSASTGCWSAHRPRETAAPAGMDAPAPASGRLVRPAPGVPVCAMTVTGGLTSTTSYVVHACTSPCNLSYSRPGVGSPSLSVARRICSARHTERVCALSLHCRELANAPGLPMWPKTMAEAHVAAVAAAIRAF